MSLKKLPIPNIWVNPVNDYLSTLLAEGQSVETVKLRRAWLSRFTREINIAPADLTSLDVVMWSSASTWKLETRRTAHNTLRRFFNWTNEAGITSGIKVPSVKRGAPSPKPASEDDITAALQSADWRIRLMVRLGAEAGLRRGEVARCNPARDMFKDLLGWSLTVRGKGGKERVIPLSDDLANVLLAHGKGFLFPGNCQGHLSPSYVGKLVGRALPHGLGMHTLRHRFASMAYERTGDLVAVQQLLGHSSPETTIRYIRMGSARLREVMESAKAA